MSGLKMVTRADAPEMSWVLNSEIKIYGGWVHGYMAHNNQMISIPNHVILSIIELTPEEEGNFWAGQDVAQEEVQDGVGAAS